MESIRDLERSSSRYSDVILLLTFILCVIGVLQLTTSIFPIPDSTVARIAIFVLFLVFIVWTFWQGARELKS